MTNKRNSRKSKIEGRYIFLGVGLAITFVLYFLSTIKAKATIEVEAEAETTVNVTTKTDIMIAEANTSRMGLSIRTETTIATDYFVGMSARYEEPQVQLLSNETEETVSEEPVLEETVSEEKVEEVSNYSGEIILSDEELFVLQQIVFAEAGVCTQRAQKAVASTILNRVRSSRYPGTVKDVVFAPNQYSPTEDGKIYFWYWPDNTGGIYREVMPEDITDEVKESVEAALNGDNPIGNFTGFYSSKWISDEEREKRAQFEGNTITIDGLVFHGDWT